MEDGTEESRLKAELRPPLRRVHKYKGELQLCQEDVIMWKGIATGVILLAAVAMFLMCAALKGNAALRQEVQAAGVAR